MLMSAVFMMSTCMMAGEGNMNKESGAYPFENRTVVPGEYVVTADKGGNVAFLREYFAEYTVLEIDQFGENLCATTPQHPEEAAVNIHLCFAHVIY